MEPEVEQGIGVFASLDVFGVGVLEHVLEALHQQKGRLAVDFGQPQSVYHGVFRDVQKGTGELIGNEATVNQEHVVEAVFPVNF